MEERIEEGKVNGAIEYITIEQTDIILSQMKKSICKVSGKKEGTGFFCKLNLNEKAIPVLMTNYHIIDDNMVESKKEITLKLNDEKKIIILKLNENIKVYSSEKKKYDIMILNLKFVNENDMKDIILLDIDDNIFIENSEKNYEDKSIYILHYPNSKKASVSFGYSIIKLNEFDIKHKCWTEFGSSGSPIISLSNNKVIGIHKSYINKDIDSFNIGTILKYPLNEFIKKIKHKISKNENLDNNYKKNEMEDKINLNSDNKGDILELEEGNGIYLQAGGEGAINAQFICNLKCNVFDNSLTGILQLILIKYISSYITNIDKINNNTIKDIVKELKIY